MAAAAEMEAAQLERSKFVQKQKQEKQELEKKIKKLKGAMKETAQKELEELEGKHEGELASFDKDKGTGGGASSSSTKPKEDEPKSAAACSGDFRERNWGGLSKKELEEACTERGLGKKGSKDDLVTKLTVFHMDLKQDLKDKLPAAAAPPDERDAESSDEESSSDEDDDDDGEPLEAVDKEEFEKQGKREKIIQKALKHLLKDKFQDGFPLRDLEDHFKLVKVEGFSPEKLGYKTIEKFIRNQPETVCRYTKKDKFVRPPKPK